MLTIENLSVRVAGRLLLDETTVRVPAGSRAGLVGRNGTGKTTLFNVLTGQLAAESGTITVRQRAKVGRLLQEAPSGPDSLLTLGDLRITRSHGHGGSSRQADSSSSGRRPSGVGS